MLAFVLLFHPLLEFPREQKKLTKIQAGTIYLQSVQLVADKLTCNKTAWTCTRIKTETLWSLNMSVYPR